MARPTKRKQDASSTPPQQVPSPKMQTRRYIPDDAVWGGFLNVRMDDESKATFVDWFPSNAAHSWALLEDVIAEGVKFSLAYDADNESWVATITGKLCLTVDLRCAGSARAGTAQEAIALLMFKHYVMAQEDWGDYVSRSGSFMKWG